MSLHLPLDFQPDREDGLGTASRNPVRRVLFFAGDLTTGGSEYHLVRLIQHLDRSRFEAQVMLLRDVGSPLVQELRTAGIPIHDLALMKGSRALLRGIGDVRTVILSSRPHILHCYGYPCDVVGALAAASTRKIKVITSRRGNDPRWRPRLLRALTNPLIHRVVSVSRATEQFAMRTEILAGAKSRIINNGIDVSRIPARLGDVKPIRNIGTLGRLRSVKGTDILLRAVELLGDERLLLHVGGPIDTDWGVALHTRYSDDSRIHFLGEIHDVPGFLGSLDLFVLPSRSEGMSNALLEAMAAGLPIVATRVGSNSEVLDEGRCGLLVEPTAEAVAAGIHSLARDPDHAARLGRNAEARVRRHYTIPEMIRQYEQLYTGLVPGVA